MSPALGGSQRAVAETADGGMAMVGTVSADALRNDATLEVRDADGHPQWQDAYDGAAGLDDDAIDVAVDGEGFVHALVVETVTHVIAEDQGTIDARLVVLRYGPDGSRVWRWQREHPPVHAFGQYVPVGVLAIVEDRIAMLELDEPIVRVELDRFGNVVSENTLAKEVNLGLRAREIAEDGEVLLGGERGDNGEHRAWVARYGRDGAVIWSDAFGTIDDRGVAVAAGPESATYFLWTTRTPAEPEVTLRRYDASGGVEWTEPIGTWGDSIALAVDCDGSVMLTSGVLREPLRGAPWDQRMTLWIVRYGADGTRQWSIEEEMPAPYRYGSGHAIAATHDGGAFVLGSYLDQTGSSYAPWLGRVTQ
jgi:hypothetical protein